MSLYQQLKVLQFDYECYRNILELSYRPIVFTSYKAFLKITLSFQPSVFSYKTNKLRQGLEYLEIKKSFQDEPKAFFDTIFKGLSLKQIKQFFSKVKSDFKDFEDTKTITFLGLMIWSAVSDHFETHNFLLLFIFIWFFQCLLWVNDKDKASSI